VELREKASRCRAHASAATDPQTAATLKAYALELEQEACRLEAASSESQSQTPPPTTVHDTDGVGKNRPKRS